jgi:hypothetical protein
MGYKSLERTPLYRIAHKRDQLGGPVGAAHAARFAPQRLLLHGARAHSPRLSKLLAALRAPLACRRRPSADTAGRSGRCCARRAVRPTAPAAPRRRAGRAAAQPARSRRNALLGERHLPDRGGKALQPRRGGRRGERGSASTVRRTQQERSRQRQQDTRGVAARRPGGGRSVGLRRRRGSRLGSGSQAAEPVTAGCSRLA